MAHFKCFSATLSLDSHRVHLSTALVTVALGTTYGAGFKIAPRASLEDGFFDVIWSERLSRWEIIKLLPAVLRGVHLTRPKIHIARAREVALTLDTPLRAQLDGEILAPAREFLARVLPGALRVIAPEKSGH